MEECGLLLDESKMSYITTMNVRGTEHHYHNVGIFMVTFSFKIHPQFIQVKKEETRFENKEPHKNTDWQWMKWEEFLEKEPKFIPFKYFFQQGFRDLNKIKQAANMNL